MKKLFSFSLLMLTLACQQGNKNLKKIQLAQVITPYGEMLFSLSDKTPEHKASFIRLAQANYWDSLTFNRVIEDFVIQGGCPDTPAGFTDPDYLIAPEFNDSLKHAYGALGMGRDNNPDKNSAICQFYIVHNKNGLARLDGDYMIFGQLVKGWNVLDSLGKAPTDSLDSPITPITMNVNVITLNEANYKEKGQ